MQNINTVAWLNNNFLVLWFNLAHQYYFHSPSPGRPPIPPQPQDLLLPFSHAHISLTFKFYFSHSTGWGISLPFTQFTACLQALSSSFGLINFLLFLLHWLGFIYCFWPFTQSSHFTLYCTFLLILLLAYFWLGFIYTFYPVFLFYSCLYLHVLLYFLSHIDSRFLLHFILCFSSLTRHLLYCTLQSL